MSFYMPKGYRFAAVHCGLKKNPKKADLVLVVSDVEAAAAGVFTTNQVRAAPVQVSQGRVPGRAVRGIVINSGNANACTGDEGRRHAEEMTEQLARRLDCSPGQLLVCSTGVIGRPLPMDRVRRGIEDGVAALKGGPDALEAAAGGILTTDTRAKIASRTVMLPDGPAYLVGFAKGAAMIGPNLATMLAFLLTDAAVDPGLLDASLRTAVDQSFHCISVEGHTSTNDTVLALANGAAGCQVGERSAADFQLAVNGVCQDLARAIIDDAEGASHVITIDVLGTRSDDEARRIAKTVAESALVKTAVHGNDPNWGRINSAAGYAGVPFAEEDLSLRVNGTLLYDRGRPTPFDEAAESARMKNSRETHLELTFTLGNGRCRFWTSDLTAEYVRLNADYTT